MTLKEAAVCESRWLVFFSAAPRGRKTPSVSTASPEKLLLNRTMAVCQEWGQTQEHIKYPPAVWQEITFNIHT